MQYICGNKIVRMGMNFIVKFTCILIGYFLANLQCWLKVNPIQILWGNFFTHPVLFEIDQYNYRALSKSSWGRGWHKIVSTVPYEYTLPWLLSDFWHKTIMSSYRTSEGRNWILIIDVVSFPPQWTIFVLMTWILFRYIPLFSVLIINLLIILCLSSFHLFYEFESVFFKWVLGDTQLIFRYS